MPMPHTLRVATLSAILVTSLTACTAPFAPARARTLEVGPGKEFAQPSAAAAAAKPGDTVAIQPGQYFDCATWRANNLTIQGAGDASAVVITDKACAGKGLFITTGDNITVRNLTLTRARVPDNNGAGIRNESPNLTVDGVRFVNNQNGILSTPPRPGTITVRNSLFDANGTCPTGSNCAHGIYVNNANLVRIERSQFTGTKQGHHIKSRAARTEVIGATIQDGEDGTASYLIEQPVGGSLVVRDSKLEKGPEAENHSAAIVIGAEGVSQPTPEIVVEGNTFANDGNYRTIFVRNLTATPAVLKGNRLTGQVQPLSGDGKVTPAR